MTKKDFTPEELKNLHSCARSVWDEIGYDCLQATAWEKNKPVESITMSRRVVIEVVCDAGRLQEYMKEHNLLTPSLEKLFSSYDGSLMKVVGPAFTDTRYGL